MGVSVVQFLGGETGATIEKHLDGLGISQITGQTQAITRKTVTLIDYVSSSKDSNPVVTELISPSGRLVDEGRGRRAL